MNFLDQDIKQIEQKGLTVAKVEQQIALFQTGIPFANLVSEATIGHGILRLSEDEKKEYMSVFESKKDAASILKFVPASGAASRMFKFLFAFLDTYEIDKESVDSFIKKDNNKLLSAFFEGIENFPFYHIVIEKLRETNPKLKKIATDEQKVNFVKIMLDGDALDYGNFPKGLLPFHQYSKQGIATAFEEHLFESALYASEKTPTKLHFTISEQHSQKFEEEFARIKKKVEDKTGLQYEVSFSYQKGATDTIAVTPENEPFREDDGTLLFRPSGHGALIENLNDLEADIVFVKNIDNVVTSNFKADVAKYKKILAGILIEVQNYAFNYLNELEHEEVSGEKIIEIAEFLSDKMNVKLNPEFDKTPSKDQIRYLVDKLNRPIRICGMVKNEDEPGGGPFWIKDDSGTISLQIVESAQIDKKNKQQKDILKGATHFNPVDLVCGIKNYKGEKFDLKTFIDPNSAFITMKTKMGKDLKALELPGLWNGSMCYWNSIFVEVPLITFNPVKTVNDLLKDQHQI